MNFDDIGRDWLAEQALDMFTAVENYTPVEFCEKYMYLPSGVTKSPGLMSFDNFPYWVEPLNCLDPRSDVREINLLKGVQVGATTLMVAGMFYYCCHVAHKNLLYISKEKELATDILENRLIPILQQSGFEHVIKPVEENNTRKKGKNKNFLQIMGGMTLYYYGANNAGKMRQITTGVIFKDELSGWTREVGQDGNADKLTDSRADTLWPDRKIFRASTPLLKPDMTEEAYQRGDQRVWKVPCLGCGYKHVLKREIIDEETGLVGGLSFELDQTGNLVLESVKYVCPKCGHEHTEYDKPNMFKQGEWVPTATPIEPGIRSYHLPGIYSPAGNKPWSKIISEYLEAFDHKNNRVKDLGKMQHYYNNTLGKAFEIIGERITHQAASQHRRAEYVRGQVPNKFAEQYCGSKILYLTCQVDVHKRNLAVSLMGWTRGQRCFLIDYWRFTPDEEKGEALCTDIKSPTWQRLRELIETHEYVADDLTKYRPLITLIDCRYASPAVFAFCSEYASGVYPVQGMPRVSARSSMKEFSHFETPLGTIGYRLQVDHYKDRCAPALRKFWTHEFGTQSMYHFNAPIDATEQELSEFTKEFKATKSTPTGEFSYWHRTADNELWDLLIYGHAAVEIHAFQLCRKTLELESVNWMDYWTYAESPENAAIFQRVEPQTN